MSGSKTQTTTATSQPYKAAQPLLNTAMGDAQALYNGPGLVQPNTMSTVVPYAQQTTQGMGQLEGLANSASAPGGYGTQMQDVMKAGGFNMPQQTALQGIQNTATSSFDPWNNPAFSQVLNAATDRASHAVNQNAAGMGRYGSDVHQGTMAREVGDLTNRMVGDEYRNWQGRQDAAQQNLFNAGQQGFTNMGTAWQRAGDPAQMLMGIGGMNEDLYGRALNDRLRITQEMQNAPLANIQALLGVAGGTGQYGTQTQSAQMPSNTLGNVAGGALGGYNMFGPLGGIGGGLLGGFL
jgi:hypothetical protein